jgi:sn-glycerol 3-phosphate transport system ATP-binding protein
MIAGLETITSGTIAIGGRIVNEIGPAERDIAMVFQNYALYPHMSVYDNMAYGLRNRGTAKDEIDKRVREAASMLAIADYLDRKPKALSGGQRQRVAMGRAIVREPQAFLFDEPLSNLDAKLRVTMRLEIRRLHNRLKATSIFVTHDQVEAMTLADQVVVMSAGRIEQIGTPSDVYRHPASRFVATFIGSPAMNIVAGHVVEPGKAMIEGAGLVTYDPAVFAAQSGDAVEIGIRPEDLAPAQAGLTFKRDFIEELGASSLVHGHIGGQALVIAQPAAHDKPAEHSVIAAPTHAVHLFDPANGQALWRQS